MYSNEENPELTSQPPVNRKYVSNPRLDIVLRSEDNTTTMFKTPTEKLEEGMSFVLCLCHRHRTMA